MNRAARIGLLAVSGVIVCYAGIGHVLGRTPDDKAYKSLTVYGEVLQKIQQDYVDEPNMHLVASGSLRGLLESLDSESSYLTPREYTEYKEKLARAGSGETGLNLSKRFGYLIVISVLPDSPAEKASLHSGDILESVAGFTTRDMSVGQAKNLLAGQPGTEIKVAVIRRGQTTPEEVAIVRQKPVPVKLIIQKVDADTMAFRFPTLEAGRAEELRARLADAEKQGIRKVILDLRACGRGVAAEAVATARLFVPSGTLATLRGQTVPVQTFSAEAGKVAWKGPVAVLIDQTTSGAAEILASAILTNKRGDLVGERTFGLASEQKLISLDDGSAIILTTANYYNGDGKSIMEEGVVPGEVVRSAANSLDEDGAGDETPVKADSGAPKDTPASPRPLSSEDLVLRKALELLKTPAKKAA